MSERAKNSTQKSPKTSKKSAGFTAEERAAMKERAKELKAAACAEESENSVIEKIAEMPEPDRTLAERIHTIVKASAPALLPKLWYGMPSYATNDGKIVCFFQPAAKFGTRYATFGFNDSAALDEGSVFPVAFGVRDLTAADEERLSALVKQAVSKLSD